jgi:hypothetical protein
MPPGVANFHNFHAPGDHGSSDNHGSSPLAVVIRHLAHLGLLYATAGRRGSRTLEEALCWRPDPDVEMVVRWALEGQRSGHEWHICDTCDQPRLVAYEKTNRCAPDWNGTKGSGNTPGCKGRMIRISARPLTTAKVKEALRV